MQICFILFKHHCVNFCTSELYYDMSSVQQRCMLMPVYLPFTETFIVNEQEYRSYGRYEASSDCDIMLKFLKDVSRSVPLKNHLKLNEINVFMDNCKTMFQLWKPYLYYLYDERNYPNSIPIDLIDKVLQQSQLCINLNVPFPLIHIIASYSTKVCKPTTCTVDYDSKKFQLKKISKKCKDILSNDWLIRQITREITTSSSWKNDEISYSCMNVIFDFDYNVCYFFHPKFF